MFLPIDWDVFVCVQAQVQLLRNVTTTLREENDCWMYATLATDAVRRAQYFQCAMSSSVMTMMVDRTQRL